MPDMTGLPQNGTCWNETAQVASFPKLSSDIDIDVAITGGGIVGITTARLLKDEGIRVAVFAARRVGQQVTGKSTAKMSSQHGIKYQTLEQTFGKTTPAFMARRRRPASVASASSPAVGVFRQT